jgi:transcriptional regulator with XRE-family HTH domain
MSQDPQRAGLFPALLKHWRNLRGLSQLDMALAAGVSSRHVSFLETGRSTPSAAMILRLAATLDVPLRHVNVMLQAAGHAAVYREPIPGERLPEEVESALRLMKEHHEPFPLVVVDRSYDVLDLNRGAADLFGQVLERIDPTEVRRDGTAGLNLARLTFHPAVREAFVNFDEVGRSLLWRLQREVLAERGDDRLRDLLDEVLTMPTVSPTWREADLSTPSSPVLVVHLRVRGVDLRFMTMVTALQAPQLVRLDDLRIESWFPIDAATADACRALSVR